MSDFTEDDLQEALHRHSLKQQTTMWAVHVQGPDDMHACPDREVADALALVLNRQFVRHKHPDDPPMKADVVPWPYGYEEWRAAAESLRFEAQPAA